MDKSFFEKIIGTEVSVTYQDGKKVSYTTGIVQSAIDKFVTIVNSDCAVCITYEALLTCRTIANGEEE